MTLPEVYLGGDLSLTFEHSDRSNPDASSESNSDKEFPWKEITTISAGEAINCCLNPTTVCYISEASPDNAVLSKRAIAIEKRILASSVGKQLTACKAF